MDFGKVYFTGDFMLSKFDRYLGDKVPVSERIFYICAFMSSVASLLFVSIAIILKIDYILVLLYSSVGIVSTLFFFLERKRPHSTLYSIIYLAYTNMLIFPFILIYSKTVTIEVPLYLLIGLVFTFVLLEKKPRIIMYILQVTEDILVCFYVFLKRGNSYYMAGPASFEDYIRLESAILISGLFCGLVVFYRNRILAKEIASKEEATFMAEKVSYAKDVFLVNVSHEIRTPLNAIIGTTEMLLDSECSNHIKEMAFNISNSSHALLSITNDLLDFSRMNIENLEPVVEKFDLSMLLNDIINLMSVRLLDSNVEFFVNVNPRIPKVLYGDSGKIRQVIINLLSNGIKYTKEGHLLITADFEEVEEKKILLKFKVEDSGIGIKPENLEKIFEPFTHSEEDIEREIEGNGMGLPLCKKLCDMIDGEIHVESEFGKGSKFFFDVFVNIDTPYLDGTLGSIDKEDVSFAFYAESDADKSSLEDIFKSMGIKSVKALSDEDIIKMAGMKEYTYILIDTACYERNKEILNTEGVDWKKVVVIGDCNYSYSGEPFESVLTKPISVLNVADLINDTKNYAIRKQSFEGKFTTPNATILVVDDNLVNLDVAAGLLQRYEGRVLTAASGKECLITLANEKVDLILLDYMMPDMDGIDTLNEIRKLPNDSFKTLPVITLTANVVSGAREMFLNAGFDDYLSKPIEIPKLEKVLADHLPSDLIKYSI